MPRFASTEWAFRIWSAEKLLTPMARTFHRVPLEPRQAGRQVGRQSPRAGEEPQRELGGDDDVLAARQLAQAPLRSALAVHRRGVDEIRAGGDADLDRPRLFIVAIGEPLRHARRIQARDRGGMAPAPTERF